MLNWSFVWSAVKDSRPSVQPKSTDGLPGAFHPSVLGTCEVLLALSNDLINKTVFHSLVCLEDVVAVGILIDLFDRLSGVIGQDLVELRLHPHDVPRMDVDLNGLAAEAVHERLMNQD